MALAATKLPEPAASSPAIDRAHFARMSFGDYALERELLGLFDKQAALLLARICGAPPEVMVALAHTLKGSAAGIGAWGVARAAEAVERAAGSGGSQAERSLAIADLAVAVEEARGEIAALLGEDSGIASTAE